MEQIERKVYSVVEVATMLGISKSTVYELIKRKEIPTICIGSRKIIPKQRFDEWLEALG